MKYIEINKAKYIEDYKILIEFNNSVSKILDFRELIEKTSFPNEKKYKDFALFQQFKVEMGDLIWNDYDMCFQAKNLINGYVRPGVNL